MSKKMHAKGILKSIDPNGTIRGAVASNESVDRDGDRILAKGWVLDTFRKQPRLLWSHDPRQLPIGKVTNIDIVGDALIFDAEFASKEANPFAQRVKSAMEEGLINTFSVGFIPMEQNEKGDISKAELYEISVVNIPANPQAMNHALKYKEFMDIVEEQEKASNIDIEMREMSDFMPDSMKKITVKKDRPSVRAKVGMLKSKKKMDIQMLMFPSDEWTKEDAMKWMNDNRSMMQEMMDEMMKSKNNIITKNQLDSFKNAIGALDLAKSTLNDVLSFTEVDTKKDDNAKKIAKGKASKEPSNTLKALRIVARATEHVIYEIKKKELNNEKE